MPSNPLLTATGTLPSDSDGSIVNSGTAALQNPQALYGTGTVEQLPNPLVNPFTGQSHGNEVYQATSDFHPVQSYPNAGTGDEVTVDPTLVKEREDLEKQLKARQDQIEKLRAQKARRELEQQLRKAGGGADKFTREEVSKMDDATSFPQIVVQAYSPSPQLSPEERQTREEGFKANQEKSAQAYKELPMGAPYNVMVNDPFGNYKRIETRRKMGEGMDSDPTLTQGGLSGGLSGASKGFQSGANDAVAAFARQFGLSDIAHDATDLAQMRQEEAARRSGLGAGAGYLGGAIAPAVGLGVVGGLAGGVPGVIGSAYGGSLAPENQAYREAMEKYGDPELAEKAARTTGDVAFGLGAAAPGIGGAVARPLLNSGSRLLAETVGGAAANVLAPDVENVVSTAVDPRLHREVSGTDRAVAAAVGALGGALSARGRPEAGPAEATPSGEAPRGPSGPQESGGGESAPQGFSAAEAPLPLENQSPAWQAKQSYQSYREADPIQSKVDMDNVAKAVESVNKAVAKTAINDEVGTVAEVPDLFRTYEGPEIVDALSSQRASYTELLDSGAIDSVKGLRGKLEGAVSAIDTALFNMREAGGYTAPGIEDQPDLTVTRPTDLQTMSDSVRVGRGAGPISTEPTEEGVPAWVEQGRQADEELSQRLSNPRLGVEEGAEPMAPAGDANLRSSTVRTGAERSDVDISPFSANEMPGETSEELTRLAEDARRQTLRARGQQETLEGDDNPFIGAAARNLFSDTSPGDVAKEYDALQSIASQTRSRYKNAAGDAQLAKDLLVSRAPTGDGSQMRFMPHQAMFRGAAEHWARTGDPSRWKSAIEKINARYMRALSTPKGPTPGIENDHAVAQWFADTFNLEQSPHVDMASPITREVKSFADAGNRPVVVTYRDPRTGTVRSGMSYERREGPSVPLYTDAGFEMVPKQNISGIAVSMDEPSLRMFDAMASEMAPAVDALQTTLAEPDPNVATALHTVAERVPHDMSEVYQSLTQRMQEAGPLAPTVRTFQPDEFPGKEAFYNYEENVIYMKSPEHAGPMYAQHFGHESVHALTVHTMDRVRWGQFERDSPQAKAVRQIGELVDTLRRQFTSTSLYGLQSPKEFVAEIMSNRAFGLLVGRKLVGNRAVYSQLSSDIREMLGNIDQDEGAWRGLIQIAEPLIAAPPPPGQRGTGISEMAGSRNPFEGLSGTRTTPKASEGTTAKRGPPPAAPAGGKNPFADVPRANVKSAETRPPDTSTMSQPNAEEGGPYILYNGADWAGSLFVDPDTGVATWYHGTQTPVEGGATVYESTTFPSYEAAVNDLRSQGITASAELDSQLYKLPPYMSSSSQRIAAASREQFEPLLRTFGMSEPTKMAMALSNDRVVDRALLGVGGRIADRLGNLFEGTVTRARNHLMDTTNSMGSFDALSGGDMRLEWENAQREMEAIRTSPDHVVGKTKKLLRSALKEAGIPFEQYQLFRYAHRAIEVEENEILNTSLATRGNPSGFEWTDTDGTTYRGKDGARRFLDSLPEDTYKTIDEVDGVLRDLVETSNELGYSSGLIDERTYQRSKGKNRYSPLRQIGKSGRINPFKAGDTRIGRYTMAQDIVGQTFDYVATVFARARNNLALQQLAIAMTENPDLSFGVVKARKPVPDKDDTSTFHSRMERWGERKSADEEPDSDYTIRAYFDGQAVPITFNKNEVVGRSMARAIIPALTRQDPRVARVMNTLGVVTRTLSLTYTAARPWRWPLISGAWNTFLAMGGVQTAFPDLGFMEANKVNLGVFRHAPKGALEALKDAAGKQSDDPFFAMFSKYGGGNLIGSRSNVNEITGFLNWGSNKLASRKDLLTAAKRVGKGTVKGVLTPSHMVDIMYAYGAFRAYVEHAAGRSNFTEAELDKFLRDNPQVKTRALTGSRRMQPNYWARGASKGVRQWFPFWNGSTNGMSLTAKRFTNLQGILANVGMFAAGMFAIEALAEKFRKQGLDEDEVKQKVRQHAFSTRGRDAMPVGDVYVPVDPSIQPMMILGKLIAAQSMGYMSKRESTPLFWEYLLESQSPLQFMEGDSGANVYTVLGGPGAVVAPLLVNATPFGRPIHPEAGRGKDAQGESDQHLAKYLNAKPGTPEYWRRMAIYMHSLGLDIYPNTLEEMGNQAAGGFRSFIGKNPLDALKEDATKRFTASYNFSAERDNYDNLLAQMKSDIKANRQLEGSSLLSKPLNLVQLESIEKSVKKSVDNVRVGGLSLKDAMSQLRDAQKSGDEGNVEAAKDLLDQIDEARDRVYIDAIEQLESIRDEESD